MTHFYFLKISGVVDRNKKKEFEQAAKFVFNRIFDISTEGHLSVEVNDDSIYHFYSEWKNEPALKKFRESEEYELIMGAYIALGTLGEIIYGSGYQVTSLFA